jgi:phosphoribosylanthranilate isomerase
MFRIKICGITNIHDALLAAEAGADAVGLNFFSKSRRRVDAQTALQIAAALPAGVTRVGVFVNHEANEVANIVERVGLDAIQLHGDEPPAFLAELPRNVTIVRAIHCRRDGLAPLASYLDECRQLGRLPDAVLVDADAGTNFGGSGQLADWTLITRDSAALAGLPLILAGGLTPQNVADAIAAVHPDAVDTASGVESAQGRKDPSLVADFITAAQAAFCHR